MSIGFTGTRDGMTEPQHETLREYLEMMLPMFGKLFIHGAAFGSDKQAEAIAVGLGYIPHPIPAGRDPLVRDREIARSAQFMLATPGGFVEVRRSGTWATIRYSREYKTPGIIIWTDGTSSPITATRRFR